MSPRTYLSITDAELYQVLDALDESLKISGCNGIYARIVAFKFIQGGKPVDDYTIGEVRAFHKEADEEFKEEHRLYVEACRHADALIARNADQGETA